MANIIQTQRMRFTSDKVDIQLYGLLYEDKPVFFAVELAKTLGYKDPYQALNNHCNSLIKLNCLETKEVGLGFRPKGIILAPESDVYRLVLRSKLLSAKHLQYWMCEEVLPTFLSKVASAFKMNTPAQ